MRLLAAALCYSLSRVAGKVDHVAQSEAIARVIASSAHASEIRDHLTEILQSPIFKASPRSQHLLKHVVEKALDGEFEYLKERLIGTGLFARPSGYDTGEDAIVRVAASDVRKRLLQFYGSGNNHGRVRIDLPPGSYIPAFAVAPVIARETPKAAQVPEVPAVAAEATENRPAVRHARVQARTIFGFLLIGGAAVALSLLLFRAYTPVALPPKVLPWPVLFGEGRSQTNIILSDTSLSALQFLLDFRISLADYANRQYLPKLDHPLSPEMQWVVRGFGGKDYTTPTAAIDAVALLRISQLAGAYSSRIKARPARSLQMRDFETDENFIMLGSPSSNPWGALFAEQLDFAFDYDTSLKTEFLRNKRQGAGELARYVPTVLGGATGRTFGIIGFIQNPNHAGHILLLAGTTAEATEACGNLVCNPNAFAAVLRRYKIADSSAPRHFEIVLGVDEMAGAAAKSEVVAVHLLGDPPSAR